MNINDRVVASLYRGMAALLSIVALSYDFGILQGKFYVEKLFYFTIISNLLCMILFVTLTIKTVYDIKKYGRYGTSTISPHIKGEIMISIILTMTVYHFILIPNALKIDPTQTLKFTDIVFHYLIPILTVFDWILFDIKQSFKWYDPLIWTIEPLLYVIFVYIQAGFDILNKIGSTMSKYIYVFLDITKLGLSQVIENIFLLSVFFVIGGYILYGFDRIKLNN